MRNSLETLQELKIEGSKSDLEKFLKDLTGDLESKGWKRNIDEEKEYEKYASSFDKMFIVSPPPEGDLRVKIILASVGEEQRRYDLMNIIPLSRPSLDYDEYNMILNKFYDLFIKDKHKKYNLDVNLSEPRISLNEYLSDKSIRLLKDFSNLANKETGADYPPDRKRWNKFVLNVFRAGEELPPSILGRWLKEVGGWGEYGIRELVIGFAREPHAGGATICMVAHA